MQEPTRSLLLTLRSGRGYQWRPAQKVAYADQSLDVESTAGATACCLSCRLYRRATIVGRRTCNSVCGSRKAAKTPSP